MPAAIKKEISDTITEDDAKAFEKLYEELSQPVKEKYLGEHWKGHDGPDTDELNGGLNKLAMDIYHDNLKHLLASTIHDDQSDEKVLELLEQNLLSTAEKSNLTPAKTAARIYKAALEAKEFKNIQERFDHLKRIGQMYLGIEEKSLDGLIEMYRTGDKRKIRNALDKFREKIPENIYGAYINELQRKTLPDDEQRRKYNVHSLNKLKEKHGREPKTLGKAMLNQEGPGVYLDFEKHDDQTEQAYSTEYQKTGTDG